MSAFRRIARRAAALSPLAVLALLGCSEGPVTPSDVGEPVRPGTWTQGPAMPVGVTEHGAVLHDGVIYVAGGITADGPTDGAWLLDVSSGTWDTLPRLPEVLSFLALAVWNDTILALGGRRGTLDEDVLPSQDVLALTPTGWERRGFLPGPRYDHAAVTLPDRVLIVGGTVGHVLVPGDSTAVLFDDGRGFRHAPPPFEPRQGPAAALWHGELHYVSGIGSREHLVDVLDPASGEWRTGPRLYEARALAMAETFLDRLHVVGGLAGGARGFLRNHEARSVEGSWELLAELPEARVGGALIAAGDSLLLIGGARAGFTTVGAIQATVLVFRLDG